MWRVNGMHRVYYLQKGRYSRWNVSASDLEVDIQAAIDINNQIIRIKQEQ